MIPSNIVNCGTTRQSHAESPSVMYVVLRDSAAGDSTYELRVSSPGTSARVISLPQYLRLIPFVALILWVATELRAVRHRGKLPRFNSTRTIV